MLEASLPNLEQLMGECKLMMGWMHKVGVQKSVKGVSNAPRTCVPNVRGSKKNKPWLLVPHMNVGRNTCAFLGE
jgi:hypothetical protein